MARYTGLNILAGMKISTDFVNFGVQKYQGVSLSRDQKIMKQSSLDSP
jgi:hypothetical protein